jgi:uncharacterized RDD family membrane protein YckC
MSCPLCGERCTCTHAGAASSLIDPEPCDWSEEQFSASLEETGAEREGERTSREPGGEPEQSWVAARGEVAPPAQAGLQSGEANRSVDDGTMWRNEVASRLESYRARRRRPLRERSLPLDFERAVNREITHGRLSTSLGEEERLASLPDLRAAAVEDTATEEVQPPAEVSQDSKIIEFPRQAMLPVMPPSAEELAEPMVDRPRILEAPEEVETASPLADIDVAPEAEQRPVVEFELPLQVASMSRRMVAGMADGLIVLAGAAMFVLIVLKAGAPMPQARSGFLLAMAAPCVFWAIYEYLFLVYAGTTPGMQLAHLRLISFDGETTRRRTRRGRAIAMVLSALSLGLGLIWALLDEDTLCWHDRITRTYIVSRGSQPG